MLKHFLQIFALFCLLAVQCFSQIGPQPPEVTQMSVNSSQSGAYAQVTVTGAAPKGISDLTHLIGEIGTPYNSANSCTVLLLNQSAVLLLNDAGTAWLGWYAVGSNNTVENSQCKIPPGTTSVSINGSSATFHYDLTFKPSYNGLRPVYGVAADANWQTGNNQYGQTGWLGFGQFNVNAAASTLPQITSLTPGSGSGSTYTFSASATAGSAGLGSIYHFAVVVGNPSTYDPRCMVLLLDRATIILLNDAGDGWLGWVPVGSNSVIENSTCKINVALTSVVISGNTVGFGGRMEFKSGLSGTTKGVSGLAADSNWGSANGWVNYGNWTIPTIQAVGTGARMSHEAVNSPVGTSDMLSGQPILMPSAYNPDTVLNLSTASEDNPSNIQVGQNYTVSVRYAAPNTQVWARVLLQEVQPTAVLAYKPDPNGAVIAPIVADDDALQATGWYMGNTDSTGYFIFTAKVPIGQLGAFYGTHSVQVYVGAASGTPDASGSLVSYTLSDNNYIGSVDFWGYSGSTGTPAPPTFYSVRKGSKTIAQGKRADNFTVGRATSTWQKVGESWNYALTLDTTKADTIRVSRMSGWEGEIGPDNPNFRRQNGWQGSQGWQHDDPSGARSTATKFELVSEWLPGPVSLYFVTDDTDEPFVMQDTEKEDRVLADAGGIFHNSVRRHVIGPAIPPDVDMKGLSALIRNWVDEGNHFLMPLVGVDIDLREAVGKLNGLKDGYETNAVDCIKAALEVAK